MLYLGLQYTGKNCYDHFMLLLKGNSDKFPALPALVIVALCLTMFLKKLEKTIEYAVVYALVSILIYVSIIFV